jgi:hypothetical protein
MHVSDYGGLLRARDGGEQPVTPLELFFDLVYVFAVTQLSHRLLDHLTVRGALETLLLLVVCSAWVGTAWITNWFDPDRSPVRLMLVAVMLASLIMSVARSVPSRRAVLRAWAATSGSRSQEILLSQEGSSQKKRLARTSSSTGIPCQGRSETVRQ